MRLNRALFLVAAVIFVAAGCSGSGGGGGDDDAGDDDDDDGGTGLSGGFVYVIATDVAGFDAISATAEFYATVSSAGLLEEQRIFSGVPMDSCSTDVVGPADGPSGYVDVGPTVTIQSAGFAAVMTRSTSGGAVRYSELDLATAPTDALYDVLLSGSSLVPAQTWSAELSIPAPPGILTPTSPVDLTSAPALDVTWSAGGADQIMIEFFNNMIPATKYVACRATDDGVFTIPAATISALPTGSGLIVFRAIDDGTHLLLGRDVVLIGASDFEVSYDR